MVISTTMCKLGIVVDEKSKENVVKFKLMDARTISMKTDTKGRGNQYYQCLCILMQDYTKAPKCGWINVANRQK